MRDSTQKNRKDEKNKKQISQIQPKSRTDASHSLAFNENKDIKKVKSGEFILIKKWNPTKKSRFFVTSFTRRQQK